MSSDEFGESGGAASCSTGASSVAVTFTPPTLDECVFQPQLFLGFMRYLGELKANENLLFIKYVALFSLLNRPPLEKYAVANRIIWTFIAEGCPCPVNISAEVRKKFEPFMWKVDGIKLMKNDMFDEAVSEIKLLLTPMFNKWLDSNEWQHIPFFHTPPPTINHILRLPSLRAQFLSYLEDRCKETDAHETKEMDLKIFQMCIKLFEALEQTKVEGASSKDIRSKARHFLRAQRAEFQTLPVVKDMEMPKFRHKKKSISGQASLAVLPDDDVVEESSHSCVDFIKEALDALSEELMDRECYERFTEEKNWNSMDVQRVSLKQTIGKDGFAEIPTLSAILHSPTYGPLLMESLKGTEKHSQLSFLLEAQEFYSQFNSKPKLSHQDRKDLQNEAVRIYETYLEYSDLELPKRVKSDLSKAVHSSSSRLTPLLFQTAGAWLFNKIQRSWIREANSLTLWADHDFDNNSAAVQEMNELFNISHINENPLLAGENLDLVPHPDDIVGNPSLFESFRNFIPASDFTKACFDLIVGSKEVLTLPVEERPAKFQALLYLMDIISKDHPTMKPVKDEIQEHFDELKALLCPLAFWRPAFGVTKMMMFNYYTSWTNKCKSVYKSGGWEPVKALTFVAGHAVPGTSWITSLGVSTDTENIVMPSTKKRWGLRLKHRSSKANLNAGMITPPQQPQPAPIIGHKSSSSYHPSGGSPITRIIVTKEGESQLTRGASSSDLRSLYRSEPDKISRVPVTMPRSIPELHMEIPVILDTLACTYLRRMFYSSFLEYRLGDGEKKLWFAFCKFHSDFSSLTDSEVSQRQKDIRDAALKVLDENPTIPGHDDLVKAINDSSYNISARFFFDAEVKLYSVFHNNYESFLATNQWVRY